jgi:hypothetical protein
MSIQNGPNQESFPNWTVPWVGYTCTSHNKCAGKTWNRDPGNRTLETGPWKPDPGNRLLGSDADLVLYFFVVLLSLFVCVSSLTSHPLQVMARNLDPGTWTLEPGTWTLDPET